MGTSDRRPYESATVLDQDLLNDSQDNLTGRIEMVAEITTPTGTLFLSDRAKYVGSVFYEPRVNFPDIIRTVGEWLAGTVEFSDLTIPINNADGKFNPIQPGGASFGGWVGERITIKIGLAEVASTYATIFSGPITDIAGYQRDTVTFTLVARSDFDTVNVSIPNQALIDTDFPDIEDGFIGLGAPVIYGDWTIELRDAAPEVPAFPVNGANADVLLGTDPLRLVVSSTPISVFDDTSVHLLRGEFFYNFADTDISIVPATDNTVFDITQMNLMIEGDPWIYASGDQFFLKVKGIDLGVGNLDNVVYQARDILTRFSSLTTGDFDANWVTFAAKSGPPQSNIAGIKSRVWIQEAISAIEQSLSMLEQVRLEAFIDRNNKFKLTSLHFEDFQSAPTHSIKNWDVGLGSFKPSSDARNAFQRAKGDYAFSPAFGQAKFSTPIYKNAAAIARDEKNISKLLTFPNLYIRGDVINQLIEMIRLASADSEMIELTLTKRSILQDIGAFFAIDVNIGALDFTQGSQVVGLVRTLGYSPDGLSIPTKIWSFQMVNFPGYTGPTGTVGGFDAVITIDS